MECCQCHSLQLLSSSLQRCFAVAKFCSAFAVYEMWCSLLERLTSTALQTLKHCATIIVNCCSAAAALRRLYGLPSSQNTWLLFLFVLSAMSTLFFVEMILNI